MSRSTRRKRMGAIARQLGITNEEVDALLDDHRARIKAACLAAAAPEPAENAPPPDVGADNMRAQIAALEEFSQRTASS
jgi:hypothetical protein